MVWMPDWMWAQKGGGKGKGGWMPPVWNPMFQKDWSGGKGWGGMDGGCWGKGGGWGKGKGKGKNKKVDATKTIWVGNLPEGVTYQELKTHGEQAGTAKWAEVFSYKGKGTGAIGYGTPEEAAAAIGILNGTILKGSAIMTDTWAKQEKPAA
mmetsp:Transcript_83811/g.179619  ORF Transcript_83811/g.179619 Transcript_83811/m.179619 type:complete len:151 (-) Transcript_83811:141-593(-)